LLASDAQVRIPEHARQRIQSSRHFIDELASSCEPYYGINTGFGYFARTLIPVEERHELQRNILLSHASGAGQLLGSEVTRIAMCLRLNVFCKGLTGVSTELCDALAALINHGILPEIPSFGSVGASGDLAPLSHLALPLIAEGYVRYQGVRLQAADALARAGLCPLELREKEGLSLINGTQIMLALGSWALREGLQLASLADRLAALSMEALEANPSFLHPKIHAARQHPAQVASAARIREALDGSYLHEESYTPPRVQDPYSTRCVPQIHGPSHEQLALSRQTVERELNAATDNPLVFVEEQRVVSGGNFHGQYLAFAFDTASMALAELGSVSERRLEQLLNPNQSGLAAFLSPKEGTCSGYMAAQYLSASLVNDNKIQATPACTDSIPGNVGVEDHVSMGSTSARKLERCVQNFKSILAVEMLAACQALDLRGSRQLGHGTRALYDACRASVPFLAQDRIVSEDVQAAEAVIDQLLQKGDLILANTH
jgi:histidine ammonia-lyase